MYYLILILFNGTAKARQKYGVDREFSAIFNDILENDYKSVWLNASGKLLQ